MTNTGKYIQKIQGYGADASFVANIIQTQHSKPATKLHTMLYLLQTGRSVRVAQFSCDTLLVDGHVTNWGLLNDLEALLDVINPRLGVQS